MEVLVLLLQSLIVRALHQTIKSIILSNIFWTYVTANIPEVQVPPTDAVAERRNCFSHSLYCFTDDFAETGLKYSACSSAMISLASRAISILGDSPMAYGHYAHSHHRLIFVFFVDVLCSLFSCFRAFVSGKAIHSQLKTPCPSFLVFSGCYDLIPPKDADLGSNLKTKASVSQYR